MSYPSHHSVPLRQRPPRSTRKPSALSATQTGRVEKSSSNPSSPGPSQLRRKALLPVRSIPALRDANRRPFEPERSSQHALCVASDVDVDPTRPVIWHPGGQKAATWDTDTSSYDLPHSSPLNSAFFQLDGPQGAAIQHADSQPPSGWSGFGQSYHALANPFPNSVGSSFVRQPEPYMFGGQLQSFDAPFAPLDGLPHLQDFSHPLQCFPPNQYLPSFQDYYSFGLPDLDPDSKSITVIRPSQPIAVPHGKPITSDSNDLVGMGLYDEPENTSSWDPQSAQYQSLLLSGGKGWKLEETFQPQGEDIEADKGSSTGDDEYRSPSPELDFEDFNPFMSDEVDPTDFESTFHHLDESPVLPWFAEELHPSLVPRPEYHTSMYPHMRYSTM